MDQLQMTALKSKLQLFILNSLKNININNNKSIQKLLKIVNFILVSFNDQDQIDENDSILDEFQLEFKAYSKASLKAEFKNNFYSICLTQLLTNFNPNLYSSTNSADDNNNNDQENYKSTKDLFVSVISNARSTDTFNVLYDMSLTLRFNFKSLCLYDKSISKKNEYFQVQVDKEIFVFF
jgi:hypothetical protein